MTTLDLEKTIETLYGQNSEIIRTCLKYVLSRRNIHGFNEFIVHKIIRDEDKVLLEQIVCEDELKKAEDSFDSFCNTEVLEIRFLRQGLVKATKPQGFENMSREEQGKWASDVLDSKSDLDILDAMADYPDAHRTSKYFDEAPQVAAIESSNGEDLLFTTSEWNAFAHYTVALLDEVNEGKVQNIIKDIEGENHV